MNRGIKYSFFGMMLAILMFGLIQCAFLFDADRDGIPDTQDPTPNGSTNNKINGVFTSGAARVVAITAIDETGVEDTGLIYHDDLTENCESSWYPQGTLCDEAPTTDDPDISTKTDEDSGATWRTDNLGETGVLVVDACYDGSCTIIDFNEVRIFQMFSDGKTTHVRLFTHDKQGDTPPEWNDPGWKKLTGFEPIGGGRNVSADGLTVGDPAILSVEPSLTRYLLIEARNDGTLGDESYIELRSVKLFSVALR